ncbi:MAG: hypothetical protein H0U72_09685 [Nitrosospira sp.]|nr:hypothetical protein [Nitrosospira sp.]
MKDSKEFKPRPTLVQIENELRGTFVAVGVLLDECFYRGSGSKLIGVPLEHREQAISAVDLNKTTIGRYLPIYYRYAYEGKVVPGYEDEINESGDNMERLADFARIFQSDSSYFDLCLDVASLDVETDIGHLSDMIDRLRARHDLDDGSSMSILDLALLADMSDRSVRNAVTVEGPGRLLVDNKGMVENAEARRWLSGRRGFVPTQKKEFPESLDEYPDQLDALEIPPFVHQRLAKRFAPHEIDMALLDSVSSPNYDGAYTEYPEVVQRAAKEAGLPEQSIQAALQQPIRIRPQDCPGIAKAISVDTVWFTTQVMSALFPTQTDMLLNPSHYLNDMPTLKLEGNTVEVILSEAMIQHGYLDLPAHAKELFPTDCFGTRTKGDTGKFIELHYSGRVEQTDIRVKSEQTISPRKRFNAWYQKELRAQPGDRIRLSRKADRVYELTYLPK